MMPELIRFASQYDPAFPQKIRGAAPEEIAHLESLAGRKFPAVYREFLTRMGKSMGDVGYSDVNFSMGAMARLHKNEDQELNWPSQFLVIAEHEQDPYFNYFLDLNSMKEGDCRVVRFDISLSTEGYNPKHIRPEAPSFTTLLFEMVFLSKHLARFPQHASATFSFPKLSTQSPEPARVIEVFEKAATLLGFRKCSYSRPEHSMLERENAAIYGRGSRLGEVSVNISAQDARELLRLRETLTDYAALH
ncbi:MAG: SMI1/KNR4 family protein [Hyalangium sp.]|uniref:SMI1/KNR4 family protein n=1 Tax=Hyalangium sp. TaxID=2028555 RepID=UPI00389B04A6